MGVLNVQRCKYNQNLPFIDNIFMKSILGFVDKYNSTLQEDFSNLFTIFDGENIFFLAIKTILDIHKDTYTVFREMILKNIQTCLINYSQEYNYTVPFNPSKTILVHLRLEDVRNRIDYDGSISSNYYQDHINNGINIGLVPHLDSVNICTPLDYDKISKQIDIVKNKYPDHEIVIITSPGEQHILPYRYIQNSDPSYDLFLLCNSEVVILSRSTFSLSLLFFGIQKDIYLPLWGFAVSNGLYTKYDNCKYNYFF